MINMSIIKIGDISIGGQKPILIAGPCAIESGEMVIETAKELKKITGKLGIQFIFKASFDKANRLSIKSGRGLGFPKGLIPLKTVREKLGIPVLTDVHETYQVEAVASIADILQIPAFLCRQTDLVVAAAKTGKPVNIKKGQFLAPQDMKHIAEKVLSTGNEQVMLTERGVSFGYHDLIFDPRSVIIMKSLGFPVIVDITHICQKPAADGGQSGGDRTFVVPFGKTALAMGADAIYMEVHPNPANAISDKDVQIPLCNAESVIEEIFGIND